MSREPFSPHLLNRCISCGFCLPACPTYRLTGKETSSPRGRINLMRGIQSGALTPEKTREESQFCLGCGACEPVCPAGVEFGHLLEEWREATWHGKSRPITAQVLMAAVATLTRVRLLGVRGWIFRFRKRKRSTSANLFLGCFDRLLFPEVSRAAMLLSPSLGLTTRQGCCGAIHGSGGDVDKRRELAAEVGKQLPGMIVATSGGCAANLADVLGADRVQDFSQWILEHRGALGEVRADGRRARVGFQDSCHLRNRLRVWREPRELLAAIADFVEIPGANECCGAAGSGVVRPADAGKAIVDPKVRAILHANIDYLVTADSRCTRQMRVALRRAGSRVRVLNLAELLLIASKFEEPI